MNFCCTARKRIFLYREFARVLQLYTDLQIGSKKVIEFSLNTAFEHIDENRMSLALARENATKSRRVIVPSAEYKLTPPELYQPVPSSIELPNTVRSNDVVLHELENAFVWFDGISTIVVDTNGDEVYRYGTKQLETYSKYDPEILEGTTLVLGAHGAHNYYHWCVDILPKLEILHRAGQSLKEIDHILLRDVNQKFHALSFESAGIDTDKIHLTEHNSWYRCERLIHVELKNFVGMRMHEFVPQYLRKLNLNNNNNSSSRNIFVARSKNDARQIINDKQLTALLHKFDIEKVYMDDLSLVDQARLFNSAKCVVSTHGAALTNLAYCDPDTTVIELFGEHVYSFFYGLSNLCSLRYIPVMGTGEQYDAVVDPHIGNAKENQAETIKMDTSVNLEVLEMALNAI